jgi:hypothetical protein
MLYLVGRKKKLKSTHLTVNHNCPPVLSIPSDGSQIFVEDCDDLVSVSAPVEVEHAGEHRVSWWWITERIPGLAVVKDVFVSVPQFVGCARSAALEISLDGIAVCLQRFHGERKRWPVKVAILAFFVLVHFIVDLS